MLVLFIVVSFMVGCVVFLLGGGATRHPLSPERWGFGALGFIFMWYGVLVLSVFARRRSLTAHSPSISGWRAGAHLFVSLFVKHPESRTPCSTAYCCLCWSPVLWFRSRYFMTPNPAPRISNPLPCDLTSSCVGARV